MTTPQWATSPVKGSHDIQRLNSFKFPSSTLPPGNPYGRDFSDSRYNGSGMISTRQLPRSASRICHGARLRRSIHSGDLRSQIDRSSTTVSVGSTTGGIDMNTHNYDHGPDHDQDNEKTARIETWRLTATTMDRCLLKSPLTPRPFSLMELKNRIYEGSNNNDTLGTACMADSDGSPVPKYDNGDETPRARHLHLHHNHHHDRHQLNSKPYLREWATHEGEQGPGYAALAMMHRAQEQVRLGIDLPPLNIDGIALQNRESDRVRRGSITLKLRKAGQEPAGVVLEPSPKGRMREMGDPVKKPGPLTLQPLTTASNEKRDDTQIYTTEGLTSVLSKLYAPGLIPSDVLAALPSSHSLSTLSSSSTPAGHLAHVRTILGPNLPCNLSSKERNYIAYYMDTLLQRNAGLGKEVKRLEEDVENAEVGRAVLQGEVNCWFAEGQESKDKAKKLEELVGWLVQRMPGEMKEEVRSMSAEMGIDLGHFEAARELVGGAGGGQKDEGKRMTKRVEEEVRYWRTRAEAGERFVGALG